MPNKYRARRTEYKGQVYDSKREAHRAMELDLLVRAGQIVGWARAEKFTLSVNGIKVCTYKPDFHVLGLEGEWFEDVKGVIARHSKIQMKLFEALHPGVVLKIVK